MLRCGKGKERCGEKCRRCGRVCWGVESVLGCGGEVWKTVRVGVGIVGKYWGRCGKVCWGVDKVRGDVGRDVEKCVEVWR